MGRWGGEREGGAVEVGREGGGRGGETCLVPGDMASRYWINLSKGEERERGGREVLDQPGVTCVRVSVCVRVRERAWPQGTGSA